MGVRTLQGVDGGDSNGKACLYDSVTGFAFGPVFENQDEAQDFLDWWDVADNRDHRPARDVRVIEDREMRDAISNFRNRPKSEEPNG